MIVYTPAVVRSTGEVTAGAPPTGGGLRHYSCFVPTLRNIEHDLRVHDQTYGPSVVVLDDVYLLRPHFDAAIDGGEFGPISLCPEQASGWRASDLLTFAEARPAPTVIVYDAAHGPEGDLHDLLSVSVLHAIFTVSSTNVADVCLRVARRLSLAEEWTTSSRCSITPVLPDDTWRG